MMAKGMCPFCPHATARQPLSTLFRVRGAYTVYFFASPGRVSVLRVSLYSSIVYLTPSPLVYIVTVFLIFLFSKEHFLKCLKILNQWQYFWVQIWGTVTLKRPRRNKLSKINKVQGAVKCIILGHNVCFKELNLRVQNIINLLIYYYHSILFLRIEMCILMPTCS